MSEVKEEIQFDGSRETMERVLPSGFVDRMKRLFTNEEYEAFLSSYGQERCFSFRLNPLKADRKQALALLEEACGEVAANDKAPHLKRVPWEPDGFYYPEDLRPGRHPRHEAGMYYIQEASAMLPAVLSGTRPGDWVLDLCAAPGGKSTRLAAALRGEGLLVANEIHPGRARVLSANLERMGVRNAIVTSETPQRLASRFPSFFDRIVVDAPCSGEGMFRKEEEALKQWSIGNVRMCAERQTEIIDEAAVMLRPGGTLVYSTCTFSPEENEGVIFRFLREHPDFSLIPAAEHFIPVDRSAVYSPDFSDEGSNCIPTDRRADANELFKEWGFSGGRPDWLAEAGIPDDPEDGDCASSLSGAVRLWPHLVRGEGHFAAVLRKKGKSSKAALPPVSEDFSSRSVSQRELVFQGKTVTREESVSGEKPVSQKESAGERRKKREKKEKRCGAKESRTKKRGSSETGGQDIIRLWNAFCENNLLLCEQGQAAAEGLSESSSLDAEPESGRFYPAAGSERPAGGFFREENLCLFGNTLYGLPVPEGTLSLDGLRVLRAGLQLGTAVKGRFEPSHSLGMALGKEEVRRAVDLRGDSREAYAWLRGESIPAGESSEKGWTLVLIDGCAAGWGKAGGGIIKNHYPRGLRKSSGYAGHPASH